MGYLRVIYGFLKTRFFFFGLRCSRVFTGFYYLKYGFLLVIYGLLRGALNQPLRNPSLEYILPEKSTKTS